ncbi:ATP-binding protein [Haliovirga abyssi]|uniref:Histidine kinase/HSP90-like ATPase domain-containing protein n=1 Tax=Haliovirga abyssi TaxID=2996794 RepID=A0AAU9DSU8_9FUSO|nr:ATP-binding protein [Haliovirga abyssi]BDU50154.1 hypothetical protein HLVA_07230 [Haliovirga abyssi]
MVNYIFLGIIIVLVILLIKEREKSKKDIKKLIMNINENLEKISYKIYLKVNEEEITNMDIKTLDKIKKSDNGIHELNDEFKFMKKDNIAYLKSKLLLNEIKEITENLNLKEKELDLTREKEYYYYKDFSKKLTYLLSEIDNLPIYENLNYFNPVILGIKILKYKIFYLIDIFKNRGDISIRKYEMIKMQDFIEIISEELDFNLNVITSNDNILKLKLYFEVDKIKNLIKLFFYSILKEFKIKKELNLKICLEEDKLIFEYELGKNNFNIEDIIDESFINLSEMNEMTINVSIKNGNIIISDDIRKIKADDAIVKSITVNSTSEEIRNVMQTIMYDVNREIISNEKIADINLVVDEILQNALEHGNKYELEKKIVVTYTINNSDFIIEVLDEGDGFEYDEKKGMDILGERGRGIFLIKQLSKKIEYSENGRKIKVVIEKEV